MKGITTEIVNSPEQVGVLTDDLTLLHAPQLPLSPVMYIDLAGADLSREGAVSILTLLLDAPKATRRV